MIQIIRANMWQGAGVMRAWDDTQAAVLLIGMIHGTMREAFSDLAESCRGLPFIKPI